MRRPNAVIVGLALCVLGLTAPGMARAALSGFPPPALFGLGLRKPPPSLIFTYHGFQIDASRAKRQQSPDKTVRALKAQVDLVEHVGLKPDTLSFMRALPIQADATVPGEAAHYVRGQGVFLKIKRLDPKKPVLLDGLLQAYHDERLAGGPASTEVARYRNEAVARHVWPKTALMLQSDTDYFALTGSTYLYGAITHEPYSRANLRQTQPSYYRWLADLFDDGRARS